MSYDAPKTYLPHQQRVLDEVDDLTTKIGKLSQFIESEKIDTLDLNERFRLRLQLQAMELYQSILLERINNF